MSYHRVEHPGRTSNGIEYRTVVCAPRSITPPHSHALPFFCLVLEGVSAQTAGGVERRREPGRAFYYPAGEVHNERFGPRGGRLFSLDFVADGLRLPVHSSELTGPTALLARRVYLQSSHRHDDAELTIDSGVLAIAGDLARELDDERPWIGIARDYLHAHFNRKLSLREIASTAGVHPVHLCRAFPRRYGMTLGDYVRALRVDYAARELMTTLRPIAEIALDAGFASQSHLTRNFRARMGVTPAAYRAAC
jgi:AraC family transcriptional regulator